VTARNLLHGFIVAAWDDRGKDRIFATGRLADGRSFAIAMRAPRPAVYVAADAAARAATLLGRTHAPIVEADGWTSFDGRALARITLGRGRTRDAEQRLASGGLHVHGADTGRATDALLALGIRGPVAIIGEAIPGRRVDVVFVEPELAPAAETVAIGWCALDIETDREGRVVAVSLAGQGEPTEALFVGEAANAACFASERELLVALCERVRARDPDVITGWNVIEFDLQVLAGRCGALGVPFDIGRSPGSVELHERRSGRLAVEVPGRVVLDAMRLVRASGERSPSDDQSLDGTARALLGEGAGKTVSLRGAAKLDELERLRRDDPEAFCAYCMRDSELVLEILGATGLDALTVRRAALTGVALDLAWTSIPAFERVYGAGLRARRIVPPPRLERDVDGAAGGTVLEAEAGVFADVLVFDFRSLYPSLMRTFHIDPLAYERAVARGAREDDIVAPNGARFDRGDSLLPAILTAYAREREVAIAAGDETAAYVYKILQNSFYGVLGASGCRYARSELAGAITSFGKHFLTLARDWFEARGLHVLYGDTDSVFVRGGHPGTHAERMAVASRLADDLNAHIAEEIRSVHRVESFLRIRCDKIYRRFFISRLRGDSSADGRGRGKGYAGLRLDPGDTTEVEVKGMEAVRSDFTPLARRFQTELMRLLFADSDLGALRAYCAETSGRLVAGDLDDELVYRKMLRRSVEEYDSETPQVRAAKLLGWRDRGGPIEYVMTRAGAEPLAARSGSALDYDHYRERQLAPIARAVANVLGAEIDGWFNEPGQLGLFADPTR
jgi:DNA polymerase-2